MTQLEHTYQNQLIIGLWVIDKKKWDSLPKVFCLGLKKIKKEVVD